MTAGKPLAPQLGRAEADTRIALVREAGRNWLPCFAIMPHLLVVQPAFHSLQGSYILPKVDKMLEWIGLHAD